MLIYTSFFVFWRAFDNSGGKRAGKFIGVMKQCIFAGKPVLKIILYWEGSIQFWLFNFHALCEFRFFDWLICTTWHWVVPKQSPWRHYRGVNSTHHCHYTMASTDLKFDDFVCSVFNLNNKNVKAVIARTRDLSGFTCTRSLTMNTYMRRICKSLACGSWFTNSSCVLPSCFPKYRRASRIGWTDTRYCPFLKWNFFWKSKHVRWLFTTSCYLVSG